MQRILVSAIISILLSGMAMAAPPVDYTLLCDGQVIGSASFVDGALHVAVVDDFVCEGTLSVAQDADLVLTIIPDAEGVLIVTIADPSDGAQDLSAVAEEVPQVAIDGKVGAQVNRAEAAANAEAGRERAAAMVDANRPELPELPEGRGADGDEPELPEVARDRRP